ncbi:60S ribosomal protein L7 [Chionoecetes opilio]|uniref:60S ribosomal protein L7 n=1 Tax=Chionoecetes opilio TaxID=41210 RepID=A0A8J5CYM9_CHIOP|nr:60S ribosomal protein L7 [Chionoecetes opilio]
MHRSPFPSSRNMVETGKTAPAAAPAKRLRVRKKKPLDKALRKAKVAKPKRVSAGKPGVASATLKTKAKVLKIRPKTRAEIAKARVAKAAARAAKPKPKPEDKPKVAPVPAPAPVKADGSKKLPAVPEILLKRRKRRVATKKHKIAAIIQEYWKLYNFSLYPPPRPSKLSRTKRMKIFRRAEKYIKEYRKGERQEVMLIREAKKEGSVIVPAESKLAFVMRIRGPHDQYVLHRITCPSVLVCCRLPQQPQPPPAVNMSTKATINMLRIAEPFIAWGYPNLKSIKQLVYKRGFGKIDRRRVPLTNNEMIEKSLKSKGIICVEDLVHEIYTVGDNFQAATNFLWPFKLNNPTGGWRKKTNHFVEGGAFGNREDQINVLLSRMI